METTREIQEIVQARRAAEAAFAARCPQTWIAIAFNECLARGYDTRANLDFEFVPVPRSDGVEIWRLVQYGEAQRLGLARYNGCCVVVVDSDDGWIAATNVRIFDDTDGGPWIYRGNDGWESWAAFCDHDRANPPTLTERIDAQLRIARTRNVDDRGRRLGYVPD